MLSITYRIFYDKKWYYEIVKSNEKDFKKEQLKEIENITDIISKIISLWNEKK